MGRGGDQLMDVLKLDHVFKSFARPDKIGVTTALSDVSLTVTAGEFISIVGPSGCGKSTILRLIAGLIFPTQGTVTLNDEPISGPSPERGMAFQMPKLFPWLTVERNLTFSGRMRREQRRSKEVVDQYLHMAGLAEFRNEFPHQLSGGMAQRLALIRTMINQPRVMLLDEPLGALDAFTRMDMQDRLLELWQHQKCMVVMVTHDIDEAIYMGSKVVVMAPRPGRIREVIDVDLPYPRNRAGSQFMELHRRILTLLDFGHGDDLDIERR